MKNRHMLGRFLFAWNGLKNTVMTERSFRSHMIAAALTVLLLIITRPAPVWWAILLLAAGIMMAVELVNTAVEKLIDYIHPAQHPVIGIVKDTLAAAVFISCSGATLALAAFIWTLV